VAHEAQVFARIERNLGPERCRRIATTPGDALKERAIRDTMQAMEDKVEVILGGWLPDDLHGGRTGRPDLLVRMPDGGYAPGDVKAHGMTRESKRDAVQYARLDSLSEAVKVSHRTVAHAERFDDYLQLAHYWRMLEAIGRAPTKRSPSGFIVGTDTLDRDDPVAVWLDLAVARFTTHSRARGKEKRSALDCYDAQHAFRLEVARTAAARAPARVQPVGTDECDSCPWAEHCEAILGPDHASTRIRAGRLDVREWGALSALGVTTVADLAAIDVDGPDVHGRYLPKVDHQRDAKTRLRNAVRRARMLSQGIALERVTHGPIVLPRAAYEVDLDNESDARGRVYLWGALVHRPGRTPYYYACADWTPQDDQDERALARTIAQFMRDLHEEAKAAGSRLHVYHYSHTERTSLTRILGEEAVADLLPCFVDLLVNVRQHYFGAEGLGLKHVAPAFGFRWRDTEPSGLASQQWLEAARSALDAEEREALRRRIVRYNEDDVRATAAVRHGMSAQ
jgi:predicted RecB family nuclease